jgi:hypothetical protein
MTTFLDLSRFHFRPPRQARLALTLGVFSLLAACAGNEETYDAVQDLQDAYEKATKSIYSGNYRRGIEILELIQARYPFSDVARQIQLDLMYAYYKSGQKELAIEAADTFMRENPIHQRSVRPRMSSRVTRPSGDSWSAIPQASMRPMPSSA